jgi:hypothetical protein
VLEVVVVYAILRQAKRATPVIELEVNAPICAYGLYLVHYVFVVWLQYALLTMTLFAAIKAAIVFAGALALSWLTILTSRRIPFGAPLVGAPRRVVANS